MFFQSHKPLVLLCSLFTDFKLNIHLWWCKIGIIVSFKGNCGLLQASPGIIANPFATGIVRKNSIESISSIDRELSPEEMDILQKVMQVYFFYKDFGFSCAVPLGWAGPTCSCWPAFSCRNLRWWERRHSGSEKRWRKWWVDLKHVPIATVGLKKWGKVDLK